MQLTHWLNDLAVKFRSGQTNRKKSRRRVGCIPMAAEVLEDRTLLSALTVNTTDDTVASDGLLTLREAILLVNNGGDANAALGRALTATEQSLIDTSEPFGTNDTIAFPQGFAGGTVSLNSEAPGGPEMQISASVSLQGPGASLLTIDAQGASRILSVSSPSNIVVSIRGVTLTGGSVGNSENGGAIENLGEALSLDDVTFANNQAERGGAIFSQGGVLNLANSLLDGNTATAEGGAIYNDGTVTTLMGVTFSNNTASGSGGAIYNTGGGDILASNLTFQNNTANGDGGALYNEGMFDQTDGSFFGNTATSFGGAVYNHANNVILENVVIQNSNAPFGGGVATQTGASTTVNISTITNNSASLGGATYTEDGGTLLIQDSTITNNGAAEGGGTANDGTTTIRRSLIANNFGTNNGGGVRNFSGTTTVINSTISGNLTNGSGGGVHNSLDNVVLVNTTITGNDADADDNGGAAGAGVFTEDPGSTLMATTSLFNTIVADNELGALSPFPSDIAGQPVSTNSASNLIGDPNSAGGLTHGTNGNIVGQDNGVGGRELVSITNVLDTTLTDNGGPTQTHALVLGGLAFNAGNNALVTTPGDDGIPGTSDANETTLTVDQRNVNTFEVPFRRIDFGTVDIGAFEIQAAVIGITANAVSAFEGDSGFTNFSFLVSRTGNLEGTALVDYVVTGTAIDGTDFGGSIPSGTITFNNLETTQTLTLQVAGDVFPEADEQFTVQLFNPTLNAEIGIGSATSTILNDDDLSDFPNVIVNDSFAVEDDGIVNVTISLTQAVTSDVSVDYVTTVGTADTTDFTPTSGTATIPAGSTSTTFSVAITPDTNVEPDEQFTIDISNLVVAGSDLVFITDAQGIGTILNDDVATGAASIQPRPIAPAAINGNSFQEVGAGNFDGIVSSQFFSDIPVQLDTPGPAADDLFFWDPRTGQNRIVFGDGTIQNDPFPRTAINGNDFSVVVFGNFDQGGGSDLFFWNPLTGRNRLMHANGPTGNVTGTIETNIVPEIAINGNEYTTFVSGDLDGGGAEDIYFWNPLTGENRLIHFETVVNGSSTSGGNFQTSVIDPTFINGNDFE